MSNTWNDIGNASLIVVMGGNPAENHPMSMAHIERARSRGGKLVVIDPRKTRTATQADRFIRIRPGTDIAFVNAVSLGVILKLEARPATDPVRVKFFEYLNWSAPANWGPAGAGMFFTDGDATSASTPSAVPGCSRHTDARFILRADGTDYDRESIVAATGLPVTGTEPANTVISNFPRRASNVLADPNTVYNRLKAHLSPYTPEVVADICGCTTDDIAYVIDAYIENSRHSSPGGFGPGSQDPRVSGYKATTMLYAMGLTQHTKGAQNVRAFSVLQSLMGNMGRAGGGINALRGIHNVQGSTDNGNLFNLIPFYSGNPTVMSTADPNAFGKYMDGGLWGVPVNGTGVRTNMNGSYDDAYNTAALSLQQRGFLNMTYNFFGDRAWMTTPIANRTLTNALYDLWPKTNGDNHIVMFQKAAASQITAMMVWGMNLAVTEANLKNIRDGFYQLDTLVVVDLLENETAATPRKPDGVTYLIPACAYTEEAGSSANSGRILQWRERATKPKGNSRSDMELLIRLAHAFEGAGAFSHITDVWTAQGRSFTSAFQTLYGDRYGWTPGAGVDFEAVSGTAEIWRGADTSPSTGLVYGSEWITEQIFREMCTPAVGTAWLYTGAYHTDRTTNRHVGQGNWPVDNRAKSRSLVDPNGTLAFPAWGYAWLVNRRVLYNNGEVPGDVIDWFMGPDSVQRIFVTATPRSGRDLNYSRWFRYYHRLSDRPDLAIAGQPYTDTASPHFQGGVALSGRFPGHTEPYESPRPDLLAAWGRNTRSTAQWDLVRADTPLAGRGGVDPADYPLVLTTMRSVEHFQGGPMTRNNSFNVELEPDPWVEINSLDAAKYGIKEGDWVNIITPRSNSTTDQAAATPGSTFARGFRAKVGVGLQNNQRVGQGVVAIPFHWGNKGLSVGSRANDLCIDAFDANTIIPEYKACLCRIERA